MARMHEAADGFSRPAGFERPAWDVAGLLGDAPFWGRFWDCETLSAQDRIYLSRLREDLSVVLADLAPQLDQGLIHADLVRENVFCATARWHSSILMIAASGFACSIWRPCFAQQARA